MTPLDLFRIGLEQQREIVAEQLRPPLPRRIRAPWDPRTAWQRRRAREEMHRQAESRRGA